MRDSYFDNAKFFLVMMVVIGHLIEPFNAGITMGPIYHFIYSFHMPLFIFIAGYFSKNFDKEAYKRKIITGLVVPYIIFETLYTIFDYYVYNQEKLEFTYFHPYWIMWFLFSLILWRVSLPHLAKVKFIIPLSVLMSILAGYASDIHYYASVSRTIYFLPFFLAGYFFKKEWLVKLRYKSVRISSVIILIISFFLLSLVADSLPMKWFGGALPYGLIGNEDWYDGGIRLLQNLFSAIVCTCILSLIPSRRLPLISDWGKNTMYVFLLHGFLIKYLYHVDYSYYFNSTTGKLSLILVGVCLTAFFSSKVVKKCFKWIVEPKIDYIIIDGGGKSSKKDGNDTNNTLAFKDGS